MRIKKGLVFRGTRPFRYDALQLFCRSELAREEPTGAAYYQARGVISKPAPASSVALEGEGYALTATDAQRRQAFLGVAFDHFMQQAHQNAAA